MARSPLLPVLACLLAVATAGDAGATPLPLPRAAAIPAAAVPAATSPIAAPAVGRAAAAPRPRTPVALELPSVGARARIRPVAVTGVALEVPDDPSVVGWWAAGGRVGQPGAALVLDGHVDSAATGPGALFRLAALTPGDQVVLTTDDGARHAWTVDSVRAYPKAALPAEVFTPAVPQRLVIVSCGGRFDRSTREYTDNIVAIARPA